MGVRDFYQQNYIVDYIHYIIKFYIEIQARNVLIRQNLHRILHTKRTLIASQNFNNHEDIIVL